MSEHASSHGCFSGTSIATKDYYALFGVITSSRYNRTDVGDPGPTIQLLDELNHLRADLAERVEEKKPGAEPPRTPHATRSLPVVPAKA